MTRIYCAGPLFNKAERAEMAAIAKALEADGYETFLPHRDGIEMRLCKEQLSENGMSAEEASRHLSLLIFCMDVFQVVEGCDALVMNLNGRVPDEGAVSEAAIAWSHRKPVVAYKADPRSLMFGCDNPLVAGLFDFQYCHSLPGHLQTAFARQLRRAKEPRHRVTTTCRSAVRRGASSNPARMYPSSPCRWPTSPRSILVETMSKSVRQKLEELERSQFAGSAATLSTDELFASRQFEEEPCDVRTAFKRDYTRILHSLAFRRLRNKTQVFVAPSDDHVCTRMEHSLLVASTARTIAEALNLNTDLTTCIAMGHDLGHAPFGHLGEKAIAQAVNHLANSDEDDDIRKEFSKLEGAREGSYTFKHAQHSLRIVDLLERRDVEGIVRPGLNLTFAVRDGIVHHDGERDTSEYRPRANPRHFSQKSGENPVTIEGCVVALSDRIAYLGRDFEDGCYIGVVSPDMLDKSVRDVLGTTNRTVMRALITSVIENSSSGISDPVLRLDDRTAEAMNSLMKFNYKHIYEHEGTARNSTAQIMQGMVQMLANISRQIARIRQGDEGGADYELTRFNINHWRRVLRKFVTQDVAEAEKHSTAQLAVDFVAGMTDRFFIETYSDMILPHSGV
ncbi:MAG: nucleoside 2-deoxyribosyltransferase [Planctomycetota bacterium]|nr:nucleoside 2-deoxyribosyltransferase [Planctomycetota bacterium]